jgi:hypothetical protein
MVSSRCNPAGIMTAWGQTRSFGNVRAIGLSVPESFLLRADELIEGSGGISSSQWPVRPSCRASRTRKSQGRSGTSVYSSSLCRMGWSSTPCLGKIQTLGYVDGKIVAI